MALEIVPCSFAEANAFVRRHHRHHGEVAGCKFAIGVTLRGESEIRGVAIIGRPVARGLQDGWTLEVVRLATDGTRGACSALYAAAWRSVRAQGYRRLVTYILAAETGVSLRAAGWKEVAAVRGRSWHCQSRPRVDKVPMQDKIRYEVVER